MTYRRLYAGVLVAAVCGGPLDDDDIPPAAGVFGWYGRGVFGVWEWWFAFAGWVMGLHTPAGGGDIINFCH